MGPEQAGHAPRTHPPSMDSLRARLPGCPRSQGALTLTSTPVPTKPSQLTSQLQHRCQFLSEALAPSRSPESQHSLRLPIWHLSQSAWSHDCSLHHAFIYLTNSAEHQSLILSSRAREKGGVSLGWKTQVTSQRTQTRILDWLVSESWFHY